MVIGYRRIRLLGQRPCSLDPGIWIRVIFLTFFLYSCLKWAIQSDYSTGSARMTETEKANWVSQSRAGHKVYGAIIMGTGIDVGVSVKITRELWRDRCV